MSRPRASGIGRRVVRGAIAGAAGTAAMDLVWYRRYRRGGGNSAHLVFGLTTSATDAALDRRAR